MVGTVGTPQSTIFSVFYTEMCLCAVLFSSEYKIGEKLSSSSPATGWVRQWTREGTYREIIVVIICCSVCRKAAQNNKHIREGTKKLYMNVFSSLTPSNVLCQSDVLICFASKSNDIFVTSKQTELCTNIFDIFLKGKKRCSQREKSGFYRINKRNSNVVQTKWIANLLRKHTPIEHFASVSNIHFSQTISIHFMHWWLVWNETNGWIYAYIERIMKQINHTGATDALPPEITNTEIAGRFRAGNSGQLHSLQINACSMCNWIYYSHSINCLNLK